MQLMSRRRSPACLSLRLNETFGLALAQLLGLLLQEKRCELHRLHAHAPARPHFGRDLLQPFQRLRCEWHKAPLGPAGIRRPSAA